jgi:outer membrane protein insertion porin family
MGPIRRVISLCLTALLFVIACPRASSQESPTNQEITTKIYFSGGDPYPESDLSAVLGVHSGQLFTDSELQAGSQRLIDTGLFDTATLTATGEGPHRQARYTIKITPLEKLLPASFENIVWFTPSELQTALRARVPLYRGLLPESGTLADTVAATIVVLLHEKGVDATVFHSVIEPTTEHPVRVVNFEVGNLSVRIGEVHLFVTGPAGVAEQLAPGLKEALDRSRTSAFDEGLVGMTLSDRILAPVRNAGYINATLDILSRTPALDGNGYTVACNAKITTGELYTVSAIHWEPTPIYSAEDFTRNATLHPGEIASAGELADTESPILLAYRKLGHMDAYLHVKTTLDDATHTVAYDLGVVPGGAYRLNSVSAIGLTPTQQQAFDANFAIKHSDPYSEPYVSNFLHNNTALRELDGLIATFQATADPNTHLVDLVITFSPNSEAQ